MVAKLSDFEYVVVHVFVKYGYHKFRGKPCWQGCNSWITARLPYRFDLFMRKLF